MISLVISSPNASKPLLSSFQSTFADRKRTARCIHNMMQRAILFSIEFYEVAPLFVQGLDPLDIFGFEEGAVS